MNIMFIENILNYYFLYMMGVIGSLSASSFDDMFSLLQIIFESLKNYPFFLNLNFQNFHFCNILDLKKNHIFYFPKQKILKTIF